MQRAILAIATLVLGTSVFAQSSPARQPPVALKGTDPVTYFNPGKPAKGAASIAYDFDDSRYLFSSAKNKDLFAANPDRYTPQFTGLCATGMGMDGGKYEADPNVFLVRDGKLYVFSSAQAREMAEKDPSLLSKAHRNFKK